MLGASLSYLEETSSVTNTLLSDVALALYYFDALASNNFGIPKKNVSRIRENIHIYLLAAAVDAYFSKTVGHPSETVYAYC